MSRVLVAAAVAFIAIPAQAQLRVDKPADLGKPVTLGPDQGAIVVGFRRPDKMSLGKSGTVAFSRYDVDKRDTIFQPRDAKKSGDTKTYWVQAKSQAKKSALEHVVLPVSSGDYVLFGGAPGPSAPIVNSFCLGAPTFRVNPGEVVYFGDVTPYLFVKVLDPTVAAKPGGVGGALVGMAVAGRANAMAYSANVDDARKALSAQPQLAAALKPANLRNHATYACASQSMTAYVVPGAPTIEAAPTAVAP
jgi:hypothetical protein